ncbi:putative myotrophin [Schistosoma mansoni]|uniref:putative myotrophin n=1 Tax=Schistosoma mansoni TaxID=6183 RepID=UPI0001A62991|nr:putative myotrophin [Schistosoma mansoni]|eukprot:XP_018650894.1 putative myotrophin [Schistosoma mansoni]
MPSEQLLWAVKNGDLQSIKENMKNFSGVNSTFKNGRTLIHYAADYGQKEICDYLIRNGADINVNDGFGVTPLLAAIYEGHIDCVSLLLNNVTPYWLNKFIFQGAKLGLAPDGSTYVDCATSEDIRNILRNYFTV